MVSQTGDQEEAANKFAQDSLIPGEQYQKFIEKNNLICNQLYILQIV